MGAGGEHQPLPLARCGVLGCSGEGWGQLCRGDPADSGGFGALNLPMRIGVASPASVPLVFRDEPCPADAAAIREIVASTGFFHEDEIEVAVELVEERLSRGLASEYHFLF